MKNIFSTLFLFFTISCCTQILVKGTVYDQTGVLPDVAVYLNNTMLGTTTDANGEFELPVKDGVYELIVSYLGYKKINYTLNTATYNKPLVFALEEEENQLDEIIIKKIVYDEKWKRNLESFKREFIGTSEFSDNCEIVNSEVLSFDYDYKRNIFKAYARKPLIIENKSLGYRITYELESFARNKNLITYLGYSRYTEMKGGKRKQKRWKKNREIAYHGSPVHFYKSLLIGTFQKEGYVVNQFKRVKNPERPSEEEIQKARQFLRLNRTLVINYSKKIETPKNALDSALVVMRKSRLPKSRDYLYKSKLSKDDIILFENNRYKFNFENNLSIVYTKEKEEMRYVNRNFLAKKRQPQPQTSTIIPIEKDVMIDITGVLINPLAVYYEGYWSYEKFANTLPLDYIPNAEN